MVTTRKNAAAPAPAVSTASGCAKGPPAKNACEMGTTAAKAPTIGDRAGGEQTLRAWSGREDRRAEQCVRPRPVRPSRPPSLRWWQRHRKERLLAGDPRGREQRTSEGSRARGASGHRAHPIFAARGRRGASPGDQEERWYGEQNQKSPAMAPRRPQRSNEDIAHAEQRQEQRARSPGHRGDSIACQGAASFLSARRPGRQRRNCAAFHFGLQTVPFRCDKSGLWSTFRVARHAAQNEEKCWGRAAHGRRE